MIRLRIRRFKCLLVDHSWSLADEVHPDHLGNEWQLKRCDRCREERRVMYRSWEEQAREAYGAVLNRARDPQQ